jgi:hypothetical protein
VIPEPQVEIPLNTPPAIAGAIADLMRVSMHYGAQHAGGAVSDADTELVTSCVVRALAVIYQRLPTDAELAGVFDGSAVVG